MQAVILAGGLGTRLRPLTYQIPKPMVPVNGQPFLQHQLKLLKHCGLTEIVILIGYLGDQIKHYFADGKDFGLNIQYSQEQKPLGTAGALKKAAPLLGEEFLVVYGDSYLAINYGDLQLQFKKSGKKGLMVVCDNNKQDTSVPSNVALDKNMMLTKYEKGRKKNNLQFVEAGVLLFKKEVLKLINTDKPVSLERLLFPALIKQGQLYAFISQQRFYDIGSSAGIRRLTEVLQ